eukprot:m.29468 g.29468  ORF g.29468 m.29468 type:complete len:443 (+) comp11944_c0_seq2:103-1431(+)
MGKTNLDAAEQQQRLEELRERGKVLYSNDTDGYLEMDETWKRYLVARDYNVKAAFDMLKDSLAWRAANKPLETNCSFCMTRPGYHSWRQVGWDTEGRAVTYSCIAQGKTKNIIPADCIEHAIFLLENCSVSSRTKGASTYVWVLDFTGISVSSCNPRLAAATTRIMARHYPERLGYALIVNAPWIFSSTWAAMKTFMDPVTVSKVHFVKSSQLQQDFRSRMPAELADWLTDEIKINRHITDHQLRFWQAPPHSVRHDPRGCPAYVDELEHFAKQAQAHQLASPSPRVGHSLSSAGMQLHNGTAEASDYNGVVTPVPTTFKNKPALPHSNIVFPPAKELVRKFIGDKLDKFATREYPADLLLPLSTTTLGHESTGTTTNRTEPSSATAVSSQSAIRESIERSNPCDIDDIADIYDKPGAAYRRVVKARTLESFAMLKAAIVGR